MTDDQLLERFETANLEPGEFHHREHVRVAWIYLDRLPAAEALSRYADGLKKVATSLGAPDLYHETITWAYLLLIRDRMKDDESWCDFAERNPDLLDWKNSVLGRYYSDALLWSDRARSRFVFPDLALATS